jgi:hypothetical protein
LEREGERKEGDGKEKRGSKIKRGDRGKIEREQDRETE